MNWLKLNEWKLESYRFRLVAHPTVASALGGRKMSEIENSGIRRCLDWRLWTVKKPALGTRLG